LQLTLSLIFQLLKLLKLKWDWDSPSKILERAMCHASAQGLDGHVS